MLREPLAEEYKGDMGCPLELLKWACAAQSLPAALPAAAMIFSPTGCILKNIATNQDQFANALAGRRLLLFRDSLVRQLMVSIACQGRSALLMEKSMVEWWPSEATRLTNSSTMFSKARIPSSSGGSLHFLDTSKNLDSLSSYVLSGAKDGDVVVVEQGAHHIRFLDVVNTIKPLFGGNSPKVRVVWMETPHPNFKNANGDGSYEERDATSKKCVEPTSQVHQREYNLLQTAQLEGGGRLLPLLAGILSLPGWGTGRGLAKAKVSAGGKDCLHFCLPGPPDVMASALFTMLLQFRIEDDKRG